MQIEIGWYFKWLVFERSVPLVLSMQSSNSSAGGFWFVLLLVDTVLPAHVMFVLPAAHCGTPGWKSNNLSRDSWRLKRCKGNEMGWNYLLWQTIEKNLVEEICHLLLSSSVSVNRQRAFFTMSPRLAGALVLWFEGISGN